MEILACALEHRGNDATGIAIQYPDGNILVRKDHEPAWRFCAEKSNREWLVERLKDHTAQTVLVHTRKMTKGSHFQNKNNHPLTAGRATIIHNGMIMNDDQLFASEKIERSAETDSDIIRGLIDKYGMGRGLIGKDGKLNRITGSVAAACLHPEKPGDLLLLRSNNPLYIGTNREHLAFASTKKAAFLVLRQWIKRFGIEQQVHDNDLAFASMPNNTGWLLEKGKLAWHDEFTASNFQRIVNYNVHTPDWSRRRDSARFLAQEVARKEREAAAKEAAEAEESANRTGNVCETSGVQRTEQQMHYASSLVTRPAFTPPRKPDFILCPSKPSCGVLDLRPKKDRELWTQCCPACKINLAEAQGCTEEGTLIQ